MLFAGEYNFSHRWRGAGVVERGGLENRCGSCIHRGFESHPLRYRLVRQHAD